MGADIGGGANGGGGAAIVEVSVGAEVGGVIVRTVDTRATLTTISSAVRASDIHSHFRLPAGGGPGGGGGTGGGGSPGGGLTYPYPGQLPSAG
jgi:hypothetical protein